MLKSLEINGFKSFAKKSVLDFQSAITSIVGPNGSGKSNVVEAVRFVLGEQSMKSLRGKGGSDLIFKGSKNLPKSNRASVTITFDNRKRVFQLPSLGNINLDFEEVSITREVHTDGTNRYLINGSEVRLKDIMEMLSSVNIGSSGHHIISQGEADRILNSSSKERRGMIEDALGLRLFQYRIRESERKLEKTRENMKEVGLLRKEIAPHLNFLKKQVEKFEKAAGMRIELGDFYREYLKYEEIFINAEKSKLKEEKSELENKSKEIESKLKEFGGSKKSANTAGHDEVSKIESNLQKIRSAKDELSRKLGRLEGMIEFSGKKTSPAKKNSDAVYFDANEIRTFASELEEFIEQAEGEENLVIMQNVLASIKRLVHNFLLAKISKVETGNQVEMSGGDVEELLAEKDAIIAKIDALNVDEGKSIENIASLRKAIAVEEMKLREADRAEIELSMEKKELAANLNLINLRVENLTKAENDFEAEIKEGSILIGVQVLDYKNFNTDGEINRAKQEELKRKIERIKIRLEDIGAGGGGDVMKEYEEVTQRDQFLGRELEDLNKSIESLEQLSKELKEKLDVKFREGIEKINDQFEEFFKLMFGGGAASLKVAALEKKVKMLDEDDEEAEVVEEDEDEEVQYGIEINVSLPHKKVKELHALSGGERSLTSIALLFAMSQVNPPPFLILDETDAALDEANSRKYGDMLELLAKFSQLVVVTHNRETMSRASTLYGVTIGSDGGSKLLSIKFDEAVAIAK